MGAAGNSTFTLPSRRISVCARDAPKRRSEGVASVRRATGGRRLVGGLIFALMSRSVDVYAKAVLTRRFRGVAGV